MRLSLWPLYRPQRGGLEARIPGRPLRRSAGPPEWGAVRQTRRYGPRLEHRAATA